MRLPTRMLRRVLRLIEHRAPPAELDVTTDTGRLGCFVPVPGRQGTGVIPPPPLTNALGESEAPRVGGLATSSGPLSRVTHSGIGSSQQTSPHAALRTASMDLSHHGLDLTFTTTTISPCSSSALNLTSPSRLRNLI